MSDWSFAFDDESLEFVQCLRVSGELLLCQLLQGLRELRKVDLASAPTQKWIPCIEQI